MDVNLGNSKSVIMKAQVREASEGRHMTLDGQWKNEKVQAKEVHRQTSMQ